VQNAKFKMIIQNLKLLSFTLSFCIFSFPLYASSVQAIQSKYQSISDLQANFVQTTYVEVLEKTINDSGIFSMKKPGRLRIEYTGEHPRKYISNGKKLWVVDEELRQVETLDMSRKNIPSEALEFLNGFGDMERLFDVTTMTCRKALPKDHICLQLTPNGRNAQHKQLHCEFGPDGILKKMEIYNKSGNVSTYVFSNVKVNSGLDDALFKIRR